MLKQDEIIIANLYSLYLCTAESSKDVEIFRYDGFKIIKAESSVWPSMVYDIADGAFSDEFVKTIKAAMAERDAGPVLFESHNENFDLYKQNGILPADRWVGMIKDEIENVNFAGKRDGIVIRNVKNEEIADWTDIVSTVLFGKKPLSHTLFSCLPADHNEIIGLWVDEIMVGTSMIHYDIYGNAGIYMVCTLEPHRRKGYGRLLVEYCFRCILKKGLNTCVLQATQKGVVLYTSMGFHAFSNYTLLMKIR